MQHFWPKKQIYLGSFTLVEVTGTDTESALILYDDLAFEQLFKVHYKALHAYAFSMLQNEEVAEEIVQNLFMKLWEKRERLEIQTSVKAFLYKCTHNDSLNYLKHQKVKLKYQEYATHTMENTTGKASDRVELTELESQLGKALNDLPQQCRTIFQMSRFEELKYREIAVQLGLSVKTVENQMGKALKILRLKLIDFLPMLVLWLINNR